jgi:AAA+ superfamily predicted ATPase
MFKNYPLWAQEFARKYLSKTVNQFILHGNVKDLVPVKTADGYLFSRMKNFLSDELFGARDIVIFYDRSSGITFRDKKSQQDFARALAGLDTASGSEFAKKLPRDPNRVFSLLESYVRLRVSDDRSVAVIIDYAETIVPISEGGAAGTEDRNNLVYLLKWAQDPLFLAGDYTLVLLTENLSDLNRSLIQSPYNSSIKVGLPGEEQRAAFINSFTDQKTFKKMSDVTVKALSQQTAGLNFINLQGLLANALENKSKITFDSLSRNKKELIEAEAYGLLEFVESRYTLDDVAGHARVKKHLRDAAHAIRNGQPDVLPMGYLVCGPVGTGKTFMVNCFAGEVGVPMVKLKNFRSQWQGVTEGNLEKILTLLDAMAPVAVMIDEADAYLGDRSSSGDSGVSNRVFAQIAQFMSNTIYRGRIIWFLMTARPDLMPVDLKRKGRAEEHIALFFPSTEEERVELFLAMKKKTGLEMTKNVVPDLIRSGHKMFSGADMEAALTRARFRAASEGKKRVSPEILEITLNDFIPPTYPEEIELQTLNAVLECTSKELLPEPYKSMSREEVSRKVDELKLLVG